MQARKTGVLTPIVRFEGHGEAEGREDDEFGCGGRPFATKRYLRSAHIDR